MVGRATLDTRGLVRQGRGASEQVVLVGQSLRGFDAQSPNEKKTSGTQGTVERDPHAFFKGRSWRSTSALEHLNKELQTDVSRDRKSVIEERTGRGRLQDGIF